MPGRRAAGRVEHRGLLHAVRPHGVDGMVVEQEEGAVQAGEDHVLVVSGIARERTHVRGPREVLEEAARLDLELRAIGRVVQVRGADRAAPVDGVEVERRGASVGRLERVARLPQPRPDVEGDVVVDELPEEGRSGRVLGVVRIVRGKRRVGDELDRPRRERVVRVEQPSGLPELTERVLDLRALARERRQVEEQPREAPRVDDAVARTRPVRVRRRERPGAGDCRGPEPDPRQESAAVVASSALGLVDRGHRSLLYRRRLGLRSQCERGLVGGGSACPSRRSGRQRSSPRRGDPQPGRG